jgi:hypothetical protein
MQQIQQEMHTKLQQENIQEEDHKDYLGIDRRKIFNVS